jgi:hypothetical protein
MLENKEHGNHVDYLRDGHLRHQSGDVVEERGPVELMKS